MGCEGKNRGKFVGNGSFGNLLGPPLNHFGPNLFPFGGYFDPSQVYIGSPWRPFQPILGPMLPRVWSMFIFRRHMFPRRAENAKRLETNSKLRFWHRMMLQLNPSQGLSGPFWSYIDPPWRPYWLIFGPLFPHVWSVLAPTKYRPRL